MINNHGTCYAYSKGCRCDPCRKARSSYMRSRRLGKSLRVYHSYILDGDKKYFCPVCGREMTLENTKKNIARTSGLDPYCRSCDIEYRRKHRSKHPAAGFKAIDKRRSMENDLDDSFVFEQYTNPCFYCESSHSMMTLDRKDHSKGHTKDNVVPCCRLCNHIRRDMPYEAWILFMPVLREINERSLFGSWNPTPQKLKLKR